MAGVNTEANSIDWDAIFEIDFVEDSDNEHESSDEETTTNEERNLQELAPAFKPSKKHKTPLEIPCTNTNYSITNLYQDGEGLFVETLEDMLSDPFNQIKHSQHGPSIVSCAQSVLQKRSMCALQLFYSILDKLWKAATAGNLRLLPSSQREKMWQAFHSLASNSEFVSEFEIYLSPALSLESSPLKLFIQTVSRKLFEKIVRAINKASSNSVNDSSTCKETQMTNVEENILRYAAGYVPFSLRRQCLKRQHSNDYEQRAKCLGALEVDNEDKQTHSFHEYTKYWIEKENRGGLFNLSDKAYLFFRAVERHCRKHFNKNLFLGSKSTDIRLPVLDSVFKDKVALEHWANATKGHNAVVSVPVMQMCVKLWINIRGHAFATNWIEQFKQSQKNEATKKALRKNLQNMSNLTSQ